MKISENLNNKKVLIWGYGREGKSTEAFIVGHCENTIYDVYEGEYGGFKEDDYDLIIKSPGIPYFTNNPKYTSQTQLFFEQYSDQVIAITGSKGKSTTSSLIYKILIDQDKKAVLVGNIGNPCFDYCDQISINTYIVFEISAHQLSNITISPHIGIFLNIYEEHLDYYQTMENYFNAKANITKFQKEKDYILLGNELPKIETKAHKVIVQNKVNFKMKLLGEHNQYNANFAYYVTKNILKLNDKQIKNSIANFENLKHRIDFVGNIDGIDYYDDSISTIPQATINAIEAIKNTKTVLIGGMDRGINYDVLIDYIKKHTEIIYVFMYASGKRIYDAVNYCKNTFYLEDLESAVKFSKQITGKNEACVLSPAAASYGYFKNFEERGDKFVEFIKKK